ncbi:hypothetical protein ABER68_04780 [Paenibacillus alvei]|uniref:hypothetical protein n=1 Tax=Niallia sp. FSL R7-0271 TaxID=2921678 RepID=UPI0030FB322E
MNAKDLGRERKKLFDMKESIRKWKKAIKVFLLIKVTNNFIGVTDTIENKAYRGINTLVSSMPNWVANGNCKNVNDGYSHLIFNKI